MPPGTGALNETPDISRFVQTTEVPAIPGGGVTINVIIIIIFKKVLARTYTEMYWIVIKMWIIV